MKIRVSCIIPVSYTHLLIGEEQQIRYRLNGSQNTEVLCDMTRPLGTFLINFERDTVSYTHLTDIIPSRQSLHATYKTEIHQAGGMCDMLTDQNYAVVEAALTEGTLSLIHILSSPCPGSP